MQFRPAAGCLGFTHASAGTFFSPLLRLKADAYVDVISCFMKNWLITLTDVLDAALCFEV